MPAATITTLWLMAWRMGSRASEATSRAQCANAMDVQLLHQLLYTGYDPLAQ